MEQLHKAQLSILRTLRHSRQARYTSLRRPVGLDSDVFKFHVQKLRKLHYIEKLDKGDYRLTAVGKVFANSLDKEERTVRKQPKLSMLLVARKDGLHGETLYLFQKRLRQPHWGYRGFISGPLKWGVAAEETAGREFAKQTGLNAVFTTFGVCRQRDYDSKTNEVLEDKVFQILLASDINTNEPADYEHGIHEWLTLEELEATDKYFEATRNVIEMIAAKRTFASIDVLRDPSDF